MNEVPELKDLLIPAFTTYFRTNRWKGDGYHCKTEYLIPSVDPKRLEAYRMKFNAKEELPLTFLYLLSQRVQTSQMLEREFPFSIPGMIHVKTRIEQCANIKADEAIRIESTVDIVNKGKGSLLPQFDENYYQNGELVGKIHSLYLIKRKGKKKKKKKAKDSLHVGEDSNWIQFDWKIPRNEGWSYAKLSGDYNPIHISSIFAWMTGFKHKIVHGWNLASRIVAEIEKETDMPAKAMHIEFLKPVEMPSSLLFEFRLSSNRNLEFRIQNKKSEEYCVSGEIF